MISIRLEDRSREPSGKGVKYIEFDAGSDDSARESVEQLDGVTRTTVLFESDDACMAVSGGNQGRYVVDVTYGDDTGPTDFFSLLNQEAARPEDSDELRVVTGGQAGTFPRSQIVNKEVAVQAASYWCKHGRLSPDLIWKKSS